MTRYRLAHESATAHEVTLLREEPAESDAQAAMKMLLPHPEVNALRTNISPPREDEYVVLSRHDEDTGTWVEVERLRRTRGGWAHE